MSLQKVSQPLFSSKSCFYKKDLNQNFFKYPEKLVPPLKWAGGKRWLVPYIVPFWKKYSYPRLVEPFCGGLSVALGLKPSKALLNDINPALIHFFNTLRKGLIIGSPLKNNADFYYKARDRFNRLLKKPVLSENSAELFYYLNRTGYNGLCRFNSRGEFNVPFGRYKKINYKTNFLEYKKIFKNWQFSCKDFEQLKIKKGDFIYADPPYDVEFTKYSSEDFSFQDQIRLTEFLAKHKGPVILSNQATKRILRLYKKFGFELRFLQAPRRISCTGDRSPVREVLALRNI